MSKKIQFCVRQGLWQTPDMIIWGSPHKYLFQTSILKRSFATLTIEKEKSNLALVLGRTHILQFGKFFFWKGRTNPLLSSYDVLVTTEFALEIIFCVGILFLYILTFKWSFLTLWCFWWHCQPISWCQPCVMLLDFYPTWAGWYNHKAPSQVVI